MGDTPRTRDGRFVRTPESAARDAEAARLRTRGWSYQQIADHLGCDKGTAHHMVQRVLDATVAEPAAAVRQLELDRLDDMYGAVLKVLEAQHFTVSNGKLIYHPETGGPLLDDAPVLQAVDRLLRIQERRARLLGLDAPAKAEVGGKLTYEIAGVDLDKL